MSADKEPMSATRRALFAGAALAVPAASALAASPVSAAERAYLAYRAQVDPFEARRGVSDDEVDAFVDAIAPLRDAITDLPCDSKSAAIAKLRHLHEEMITFCESGDELVAQVLGWLEAL